MTSEVLKNTGWVSTQALLQTLIESVIMYVQPGFQMILLAAGLFS